MSDDVAICSVCLRVGEYNTADYLVEHRGGSVTTRQHRCGVCIPKDVDGELITRGAKPDHRRALGGPGMFLRKLAGL